jgi:hypothetical protein
LHISFTVHAEVNEFVDYLGAHNVKHGQVWLDIETNPSPGCGWGVAEDLTTGYKNETLGESNCAFVGELISALRARGEVPGTYVSARSRLSLSSLVSSLRRRSNVTLPPPSALGPSCVQASSYMWNSIMGSSCTIASSTPIWCVPPQSATAVHE